MPVNMPSTQEIENLLGKTLYEIWQKLTAVIDANYDADRLWNSGGKWKYEYKYRRGGKTLCSLFANENRIGFMVVFGKDERDKFEAEREIYTACTQDVYDRAHTYRDGKWLMFEPSDTAMFDDFLRLLRIKRKPNKKNRCSGPGQENCEEKPV